MPVFDFVVTLVTDKSMEKGFAWPKEKFPSVRNMQISVSNIISVLLLSQYSVKKDAINSFSRLSRQSSTMPVFDHVVTLVRDESMEEGFVHCVKFTIRDSTCT